MATKRIVTGEYNQHGYTVLLCRPDGVRTVYSAGNNPRDSQQNAPTGVGLRQLRGFCIRTCREIATERRADYGGVTRIEEEDSE